MARAKEGRRKDEGRTKEERRKSEGSLCLEALMEVLGGSRSFVEDGFWVLNLEK